MPSKFSVTENNKTIPNIYASKADDNRVYSNNLLSRGSVNNLGANNLTPNANRQSNRLIAPKDIFENRKNSAIGLGSNVHDEIT